MNTTLSLESILHMLKGLSLANRQWLADHLIEPSEQERAALRKNDEVLVRRLHALRYEGEMTADEMKKALRDSRNFGLRKINYEHYDDEQ